MVLGYFSYIELLEEPLRRDDTRGMSGNTSSFVVLLPLMQLDVLWIQKSCRLLRLILQDAGSGGAGIDIIRIRADHRPLRRSVEDIEYSLDHLKTHVTWEEINVWLKQAVYEKIE